MNKPIIFLAIGVFIAPVLGLLGTVMSMVLAFHDLGDQGISDPKLLSAHIGTALFATWAGLGLSGILLVVLIVCLLANRSKKAP